MLCSKDKVEGGHTPNNGGESKQALNGCQCVNECNMNKQVSKEK